MNVQTPDDEVGMTLEAIVAREAQKLADLTKAYGLLERHGLVPARIPPSASEEFAEMCPMEAIRIILKRKGEATTRELHDALLAGGLRRTRATDLINSIGVTLSKATKSKTSDIVKRKEGKINYWRLKTTEATAPVGGKAPTRRRPANYYYQQNPADTVG